MLKFLLIPVITFTMGNSVQALPKTIFGQAKIIDGDSIKIGDMRIRLHGIDTPELRQTCTLNKQIWLCGKQAKQKLKQIIRGQKVRCTKRGTDRYRRILAVCFVHKINLNATLVQEGWALAYRRYSKEFVKEENKARIYRRGIWRGKFVPPWEWRKRKRQQR